MNHNTTNIFFFCKRMLLQIFKFFYKFHWPLIKTGLSSFRSLNFFFSSLTHSPPIACTTNKCLFSFRTFKHTTIKSRYSKVSGKLQLQLKTLLWSFSLSMFTKKCFGRSNKLSNLAVFNALIHLTCSFISSFCWS